MPDFRQTYRSPHFIGEVADAARERVLRKSGTLNCRKLARAVRFEAGAAACGGFAKVVRIGRRYALHTGPFPLEGHDVVGLAFVESFDPATGAATIFRPAH